MADILIPDFWAGFVAGVVLVLLCMVVAGFAVARADRKGSS